MNEFTVQAWMNTADLNKWTHVAVVRKGNLIKYFIDGKRVQSNSLHDVLTTSITEGEINGEYYNGYMSDFTVYKKAIPITNAPLPPASQNGALRFEPGTSLNLKTIPNYRLWKDSYK